MADVPQQAPPSQPAQQDAAAASSWSPLRAPVSSLILLAQLGVIPEGRRDQDPALLVELALDRGREIEAPEGDDVLVELGHFRDFRLELLNLDECFLL